MGRSAMESAGDAVEQKTTQHFHDKEIEMFRNRSYYMLLYSAALLVAGAGLGRMLGAPPTLEAQMKGRVFELRTYTAPEGKLGDLHKRFRDHTMRIFEKHGMTSVGYWMPEDAPLSQNTMVYLLAHPAVKPPEELERFAQRPEWKKVASESQANGPLTSKIESVFPRSHGLFADEVRRAHDAIDTSHGCGWDSGLLSAGAVLLSAKRMRAQRRGRDDPRFTGKIRRDGVEGSELSAPPLRSRRAIGVAQPRQGAADLRRGRTRSARRKKGQPIRELGVGDSDYTGPNVVHWHGAVPQTHFVQVAVSFGGDIKWMEKVTDGGVRREEIAPL